MVLLYACVLLLDTSFENTKYLTKATDPTPTPQQTDAATPELAKNYDENARRTDRDPHVIFRTHSQ